MINLENADCGMFCTEMEKALNLGEEMRKAHWKDTVFIFNRSASIHNKQTI